MALISKKPMRRSALITPWGAGAIVPFPNDESLMIAGLDMWQYTDKGKVNGISGDVDMNISYLGY